MQPTGPAQATPGTQRVKRRRVSGEDIQQMSAEDVRRTLAEYATELTTLDELSAQLAPAEGGEEPGASRTDLLLVKLIHEMKELRNDLSSNKRAYDAELSKLKDENTQLRATSYQHQRFLEQIDSRLRETNVVIMGVPDGKLKLKDKSNDDEKCLLIFREIQATGIRLVEVKRLGEEKADKTRPILVRLNSRIDRDSLIEKAKSLKDHAEAELKSIYIKKDIHPLVRKEWKRLKDAETALNNDPSKGESVIMLDPKKRVITKDGVVVDRWQPNFFA